MQRRRRALEQKLCARRDRCALIKKSILRPTGIPLHLQLSRKQNRVAWDWTNDSCECSHFNHQIWQVAEGLHFIVYLSAAGNILYQGEPRHVHHQQLELKQRKRNALNASSKEFTVLSPQKAAILVSQQDATSCLEMPFQIPGKHYIRQIACGISHCVALGEFDGNPNELYAWGIGQYGQLGLGSIEKAPTATPIKTSTSLTSLLSTCSSVDIVLRCGPFSTYALVGASLWHWGLLPTTGPFEKFVHQGVPVEFPLIADDITIVDVGVGFEHIVLLSSSGDVFSWGYGHAGQLGLGLQVSSVVQHNPIKIDFCHPEVFISAISCGWHHTLAVASDGRVFAWGSNRYGACGASTKFHEYFHPVQVAIQSSPMIQEMLTVACCGNTSSIAFRRADGSCKRVMVCGVCSPSIAVRLPIDIPETSYQPGLLLGKAGFGVVRWLYAKDSSVDADVRHIYLIHEITSESHDHRDAIQHKDKVMSRQLMRVGEHLTVKLKLMPTPHLTKISSASKHTSTDAFAVIEHPSHKKVLNLREQGSSIQSFLTVVSREACQNSGMVHIEVQATAPGKALIGVTYANSLVFGNALIVEVTDRDVSRSWGNEGQSIQVLGVSITEQDNVDTPELSGRRLLADTKWNRVNFRRLRVYTNDNVLLLFEFSCSYVDPVIIVKSRTGDSYHANIEVFSLKSKINRRIAITWLAFPSPGSYTVYAGFESLQGEAVKMFDVDCCMSSTLRIKHITTHRCAIMLKRDAATQTASHTTMRYSIFLTSLMQMPLLRDALVYSPMLSTTDLENESQYDFDREARASAILRQSSNPFVLWEDLLGLCQGKSNQPLDPPLVEQKAYSILDILPCLQDAITFSLLPVTRQNIEGCASCVNDLDEGNVEEPREQLTEVSLHVPQSPSEMLVDRSISLSLLQLAPSLHSPLEASVCRKVGVRAWRNHHGDFFYSTLNSGTASYIPNIYGYDSHPGFAETLKNNPIVQVKMKLQRFLWQIMESEDQGINELFLSLCSSNRHIIENELRLSSFSANLKAHGFGTSIQKQEWYALFRDIQSISLSGSGAINIGAFRTLLLDPFHRLLAHESSVGVLVRRLYDCFCLSQPRASMEGTDAVNAVCLSWYEFAACLNKFHCQLVSPSSSVPVTPPSDYYCRILYRFDVEGSGWIQLQPFLQCFITTIQEVASRKRIQHAIKKQRQQVAVSSERRPNVDDFSTPNAVQKLFTARAQKHEHQQKKSKNDLIAEARASLLCTGNSHLARIRNLPVTRLLQEGIYFRPQHYRVSAGTDSTEAAALGAEESY